MPNIRSLIDAEYAKEYYSRPVLDYWRVSKLGMPFDAYHNRLGSAPDEQDPYDISRGQMIMDMGTAIHRIIQDKVQKIHDTIGTPILILGMEEEIKSEELHLVGHYDMFLEIDGVKILYDIKTINEKAYTRMKEEGGGVIKPYSHHVKQVLVYDWLLGGVADEIRILYVDRNNGRREEIEVQRDSGVLDEAKSEIDMLNACWESKTPPPPPSPDKFQYKYSQYKNLMEV